MENSKTTLANHLLLDEKIEEFWVFAYGSLMWKPDFDFSERARAHLSGFSRALCIYSWVHRGTKETPGLVFGLDKGGTCEGFAFKIPYEKRATTIEKLRARELVTGVYREMYEPLTLLKSPQYQKKALFYCAVQNHEQYAGQLTDEEKIRLIKQGVGRSGINTEYVLNTHKHLLQEGIEDAELHQLCEKIS